MVTNVGNIYGQIICDGPLYTQIPSTNVGQPQIGVYRLCVAGQGWKLLSWRRRTVTALQIENGSGKNTSAGCGAAAYAGSSLSLPPLTEASVSRDVHGENAHISRARRHYPVDHNRSAGGDLVQPELVSHSDENTVRQLLVHDAAAAADDRLTVAVHVPRETHAWRKIVVIAVKGRTLPFTNLYEPRC